MKPIPDLGNDLDVLIAYAAAVGGEAAIAVLQQAHANGAWRADPGRWVSQLSGVVQWDPSTAGRTKEVFADAVAGLLAKKPEGPNAALFAAFLSTDIPEILDSDRRRLVDWFVDSAGAGESSMAAGILLQLPLVPGHDEARERLLVPLAKWLVTSGSLEFRSRAAHGLVLVAGRLIKKHVADRLLLRQCLVAFARSNAPPSGFQHSEATWEYLDLVEDVLDQDDVETAVELLLGWGSGNVTYLLPLVLRQHGNGPKYPRLRHHLLAALARGYWDKEAAEEGWRAAFWCAPSIAPELHFRFPQDADRAVGLLRRHALGDREPTRTLSSHVKAWAEWLTTECIRVHGVDGIGRAPWRELAEATLYASQDKKRSADVASGVASALRVAFEGCPQVPDAVVGMLSQSAATPMLAVPILFALGKRTDATKPASTPSISLPLDGLLRVLRHPWRERVAGVRPRDIFGSLTDVRLDDLGDDNQVRDEGTLLVVNRRGVEGALAGQWTPAEQEALACMYVVHELIHHRQGVGLKQRIGDLRLAGGETTLMHVDLGADNLSARLAAEAIPSWEVVALKDLQGRSLVAYPAGQFHSLAARIRKAQRLVALRLEVSARRAGVAFTPWPEEGYAFAEFGAVGGTFLMLHSGPPYRAWGAAEIDEADAEILTRPIDPERAKEQFDELDALLMRLVREARDESAQLG